MGIHEHMNALHHFKILHNDLSKDNIMGVVTIQQAKKGVGPQRKTTKI
jgi:hypothetical protein